MNIAFVALLKIFIISVRPVFTDENVMRKCSYKPLNSSQIFPGNVIHPTLLRTKSSRPPFSNLRIYFEYTSSFTDYPDSSKIRKEVMEPAKERLESVIKVKNPSNGILRVNRACKEFTVTYTDQGQMACAKGCTQPDCGETKVPEEFLNKCFEYKDNQFQYTGSEGAGVLGYDIILIVLVKDCSGNTLASAVSCFLESKLDRPVLGMLHLCRNVIKAGENVLSNRLTVQHEIIHALGFSSDKFAYFRFPDGNPIVTRIKNNIPEFKYNKSISAYPWTSYITKQLIRKRSSETTNYNLPVFAFVLPTVLNVARKHFNCPSLDGVDLEPYPILSHFSEYALHSEVMTPVSNGGAIELSKFTLALLKDSGWYDADFSKADYFDYGKNQGCLLIFEGCFKYMVDRKSKGKSIEPFCDVMYTYGKVYKCAKNRKYFGFCNLVQVKDLDKKYQYFQSEKLAGGSPDNEHCPVLQVLRKSISICQDSYSNQVKGKNDVFGSYYGSDSACFEYDVLTKFQNAFYGASCLKYKITSKPDKYSVYFEEKTIDCPITKAVEFTTKEKIKINFTCPPLHTIINKADIRRDRISKILWLFYILLYVFM